MACGISRGVGGLRKNPFCGEVWIIYGTTHYDFVFACRMSQEQVALEAHHLKNRILTEGILQSQFNEWF